MEKKSKIRLLNAEEIECRVSTISEKGVSVLLYKDARVDQNILDETFGIFGWQRKHEQIGDGLFCTIMVKDDNGEWISKQDVGTPSFAEPVKGAASDSFKRACFNLGIGRELYTAPFIWISAEKVDIRNEKGKWVVKDKFILSRIQYDKERACITGLEIQNGRKEVVYSYGKQTKAQKMEEERYLSGNVKEQNVRRELERTGVSEEMLCARYGIQGIEDMTDEIYLRAMEALGKTKGVAA